MNGMLLAATAATLFDCSVSAPVVVSPTGATSVGGMPDSALRFGVELSRDNMMITWPGSPIQLDGRAAWFSTGVGIGSAFFLSRGPCLFTETACGHSVNFARQPDQSLVIQIEPTAFTTEQDGSKHPFAVILSGHCTPRGSQQ